MIKVLIVEDQRMMREMMETYVRQTEGYSLVGSLPDAKASELFCASNAVDLVLMDVCTENDESGFAATETLKKRFPNIKVVIVTSMLDASYLERAKEVGADSIWFKDTSREALMNVAERTVKGEKVYPDRTPAVVLGNATSYDFTEAEVRVLRLLVEGMTYKEMGDILCVTPDCIKKHISSMLSKTGFTSKTKLAAAVVSKRLIVNGF